MKQWNCDGRLDGTARNGYTLNTMLHDGLDLCLLKSCKFPLFALTVEHKVKSRYDQHSTNNPAIRDSPRGIKQFKLLSGP